MFKTFRLMLLAAFTMVCGSVFAQEETTITWLASSGDPLTTIYPDANISLKWEEGGGDFAPKYLNGNVYFYNGNRLTVAGVTSDVTINKIVFTLAGDRYTLVTCNAYGKIESDYGITVNRDDDQNYLNTTWEGSANSIIFRAPIQSKERYISSIEVTYTGGTTGPVETAPVLNITTTLGDSYDMDANGVFVVYAKNEGTAAAENTKMTVFVDGNENSVWTIGTLAIGDEKWNNTKFNLDNIEAGEHQVKLALTADNAEAFELEKTVTFTKKAAEATFELTAQNVEVQLPVENISIPVTVKNTSDIDASNVVINLWNNGIIASETIAELAGGAETVVTFTINALAAGTYNMQALTGDNRYGCQIAVTVLAAPVEDVFDLAITSVSGTIDKANETSNVRVIVVNNGNVAITDAPLTLTAGQLTLNGTVSAAAEQQGWCVFAVPTAGFEAGEVDFVATVEVADDATPNDNTMTATLTVVAAPVPEATFELSAQNVEVQLPVENISIPVTVKNTSDIDASNVVINLWNNGIIATETIAELVGGAETEVTFTIGALAANTYEMQALTADNKYGCRFNVTVLAAPEAPVIDMAIEAIQGITEINLKEENKVTVWYKNNGNQKMENVAIMFSVNDHAQEQYVTVEAGINGYVEFTIPTDIFEPAEDTEAELVAWVNVENDADATNDRVTKTLPIVSGEVAPVAEIAINPISGWEVEAGEQTVTVGVTVYNNGEVDAKDVKVEVFKSYGDGLCDAQIVDVPAGEENNYKMLTFSFTYNFEAGKSYEFTAYTGYADANLDNNTQKFTITCPAPVANIAIAKIADVEATTEEDVVIAATLTNNSEIAANDVMVGVYTVGEDYQFQLVGFQQNIEEIAAGESANVEFNLGKLAVGNYTYYVQVTSVNGTASTVYRDVTVKVTEPFVEVIDMGIQAIQGPAEINLKGVNTYKVWYINEGNVTVENANIILLVDGENEAGRQAVTVEPGKNGMVEITLDLADFEPTEDLNREVTIMGYVNVEGDVNPDNNKSSMTAVVVSKDEVAEPTFTIDAQPVEVEFGAEKFDVVATIATDIDAENVEVQLFYNQTIATQTVSIAAGQPVTITFTDVENPFTKAGDYTMYVLAGKAAAEVAVTVKPEAVEETIDMAVTAIQNLSQINLKEENKAQVWYENKGTKDLENVVVMFSVNDDVQEATVSVAAGKNGYVEFIIDTTNILPEDEDAEVVAWVNVEGDVDNTNDKVTKVVPVINGETPVATFAVTAENVTVPFGAQSFDIVATVANTGDVNGGVDVKLLKGIETVATEYKEIAAGKDVTVTFTIEAPDGGFEAGKTVMYYVQAGNDQATVEVKFESAPVEETIDMAITAIQGLSKIDLTKENKVQVWYENKGTKNLENVAIMFSVNDNAQEQFVNVAAGRNGYVEFIIDAADFEPTEDVEAELIAWVNVEGDVDNTNDKVTRTVPVVYGEPELSFIVGEVNAKLGDETFNVNVTVMNTGKAAAENVEVKIYNENSTLLDTKTIETIAAGEQQTVTFTFENTYNEEGIYRSQFQVWVKGVEGVKWVSVEVIDGDIVDAIKAIKAQYGENVQIFTLSGKKVNNVQKGQVYIINGTKVMVK